MCGECLQMIKPMVVVFVLVGLDATLVVEFDNTCIPLREVKCLHGYSKTLWMINLTTLPISG